MAGVEQPKIGYDLSSDFWNYTDDDSHCVGWWATRRDAVSHFRYLYDGMYFICLHETIPSIPHMLLLASFVMLQGGAREGQGRDKPGTRQKQLVISR